jgi:hypothetical protein
VPEQNLPDNNKTHSQASSRRYCCAATSLRQIVLKFPKPDQAVKKAADYIRYAFHKIRDWLKEPKAWVELLTVLFVGCYSCLTYRLVSNTKAQFETSERPWVGLVETTVSGYPTETSIPVTITFENGGKSPASQVWFRNLTIAPVDSAAYERALSQCAEKPASAGVGTLLLPGLHRETTRYSDPLKPTTIEYIREQLAQKPKPAKPVDLHPEGIALVGCIDYMRGEVRCYRTRFCEQYAPEPGSNHPYGFFFYCNFSNTADENTDCRRK